MKRDELLRVHLGQLLSFQLLLSQQRVNFLTGPHELHFHSMLAPQPVTE